MLSFPHPRGAARLVLIRPLNCRCLRYRVILKPELHHDQFRRSHHLDRG